MTSKVGKRFFFLMRRMRYWSKMIMGTSYSHLPQGLGTVFEPGKLAGYFNDLTGKTNWHGEVDIDGVPVNTLSNGQKFQFPILIAQKALGHWDRWHHEKDEKEKVEFLRICGWLVEHQDEKGGWNTWRGYVKREYSDYSAMTQGQGLSVLIRGWMLTDNLKYKQAAKKATRLFFIPVHEGGVTCFEGADVFLEERPCEPRNTILNGWIFSLFGLYDYNLNINDDRARELFEKTLRTLAKNLAVYDSGYWSYYDLSGRICSPFYHRLHISQLEALTLIGQEPVFDEYRRRWIEYCDKFANKSRAFVKKAVQKLKEPARVIIVR